MANGNDHAQDLCGSCGRNMDKGEPHTADCRSALAQDALERGNADTSTEAAPPQCLQGSRGGSLIHYASGDPRTALCGAVVTTPRKKPKPSLGKGICPKCTAKARR